MSPSGSERKAPARPLGIDLLLQQQGLDITTPARKVMFQMMGV
jgi:hypothetical protein